MIFGIDDAIIGLGAAGIGAFSQSQTNAMNQQQFQQAQTFNAQQAEQARGFAREMSNTAYQRQVEDMRKAGINPMVAVMKGGGASTPTVGAASAPTSPRLDSGLGAGLTSALETRRLQKDLEATSSQVALNEATKKLKDEERKVTAHSAREVRARADLAEARLPYEKKKAEGQSWVARKVEETMKHAAEAVKDPGVEGTVVDEYRKAGREVP